MLASTTSSAKSAWPAASAKAASCMFTWASWMAVSRLSREDLPGLQEGGERELGIAPKLSRP
jgi:hypothetical protein